MTRITSEKRAGLDAKYFAKVGNRRFFSQPLGLVRTLLAHDLSQGSRQEIASHFVPRFSRLLKSDPARAEQYLFALVIGAFEGDAGKLHSPRNWAGRELLIEMAPSLLQATEQAGATAQSQYLEVLRAAATELGEKVAAQFQHFEAKYVSQYPERLSTVREAMAQANAQLIPLLLKSGNPAVDQLLEIQLRMSFDWYTEVCETAAKSLRQILPALIRANHPRTAQVLELTKKLLRDPNDFIQGYATEALGRATLAYQRAGADNNFQELFTLLIKRATTNRVATRRAAALRTLLQFFAAFSGQGIQPDCQAQIIAAFQRNAKRLEHDGSRDALYNLDDQVFNFIFLLQLREQGETALALLRQVINAPKDPSLSYSYPQNVYRLFERLTKKGWQQGALAKTLISGFVQETHHLRRVHDFIYYLPIVALVEDPVAQRTLIENLALNLRLLEARGKGLSNAGLWEWIKVKDQTPVITEIIGRAAEVGVAPLLVNYFIADLDVRDADNSKVGRLRQLVTEMNPISKFLYDEFQLILHSRPCPKNLKAVRFYLKLLRSEKAVDKQEWLPLLEEYRQGAEKLGQIGEELRSQKAELEPRLAEMEKILSAVYELDLTAVRKKLLRISAKIADPDFHALRRHFGRTLTTDSMAAARLLGEMMKRVAQLTEPVLPTIEKGRLLWQLHFLGYGLYNRAFQQLSEKGVADNGSELLALLLSQTKAAKAIGFTAPRLDLTEDLLKAKGEELKEKINLDKKDQLDLLVINQALQAGITEAIDLVDREMRGKVVALARVAKADQEKAMVHFTDNLVRASVLHQLSEMSVLFCNHLDQQNPFPRAQALRGDFIEEWDKGERNASAAKLAGMIIDLARGAAPLDIIGLKLWVERHAKGLLEMYTLQLQDDRFGAAFLDDQELTIPELKSVLGVSASNSLLMSLWRYSD